MTKSIPIPRDLRWRYARLYYIPVLLFIGLIILAVILWRNCTSPRTELAAAARRNAGILAGELQAS